MRTDVLDTLCGRWSDNCTACILARETPNLGQMVPVRCQWVAGASSACIALPGAASGATSRDTLELVSWIRKHQGTAGSEHDGEARRYDYARPVCRWIVRDHTQCAAEDAAASDAARRCTGMSSPTCQSCSARGGSLCGFCAESKLGYGDSALAPTRCVAAADHMKTVFIASTYCAVPCEGSEELFDLSGEAVLQGVIEYPLWRQHGLSYARDQKCRWFIGMPKQQHVAGHTLSQIPGGVVSGSLTHSFAKHDALHVGEAGSPLGEMPNIFGSSSTLPLKFSRLTAPVSVEFFSDSTEESTGFTLSWTFKPAASSAGGVDIPSAADADAQPNSSMSVNDIPFAAWVIAAVVGAVVLVLLMCISCNCWKRHRRRVRERNASKIAAETKGITPNPIGKNKSAAESRQPSASAPPYSGLHSQSTGSSRPPPKMPPNVKRNSADARSSESSASNSQPKSAAAPPPPPPPPRTSHPPPAANRVPPEAPSRRSHRDARDAGDGGTGSGPRSAARGSSRDGSSHRSSSASASSGGPGMPSNTESPGGPKTSSTGLPPPPPPGISASLPADAAAAVTAVHRELQRGRALPEAERKILLRDLQRRWHPDKNPDADKAIATTVFQHIGAHSAWLLAGDAKSGGS